MNIILVLSLLVQELMTPIEISEGHSLTDKDSSSLPPTTPLSLAEK